MLFKDKSEGVALGLCRECASVERSSTCWPRLAVECPLQWLSKHLSVAQACV